jgi:hypothetical protein
MAAVYKVAKSGADVIERMEIHLLSHHGGPKAQGQLASIGLVAVMRIDVFGECCVY